MWGTWVLLSWGQGNKEKDIKEMTDSIKVWRIDKEAVLPKRMTEGSVGYDICAIDDYFIQKNEFVVIKTGLVIKPPNGCHLEIALRSSMPGKKGLLIPNGMGILDGDYCGEGDEIGVLVYKFGMGSNDFTWTVNREMKYGCSIEKGERVAQLLVRPTLLPPIENCTGQEFEVGSRGGFGSTGDK
jgi:dUTP pyrophosphatase